MIQTLQILLCSCIHQAGIALESESKTKKTSVTLNCQAMMGLLLAAQEHHFLIALTPLELSVSDKKLRHQQENVKIKTLSRTQSIRQLLGAGNSVN